MVERKKDPVTGKFSSDSEPNDKFFALRLPESLLSLLKQTYGDKVAAFIREAIAEKLERESHNKQPTAHEFKSSQLLINS